MLFITLRKVVVQVKGLVYLILHFTLHSSAPSDRLYYKSFILVEIYQQFDPASSIYTAC